MEMVLREFHSRATQMEIGRAIRMAHPGELVETIASALGVPRQTVVQHDRQLVARGYRRKGGRGRSAVHVTPEDAANLLIAVAAAPVSGPVVKETIATFEKYSSLPAWMEDREKPADWSGLRGLSELPKGHSLSKALAALIHGFARGDFENADLVWRNLPDPADVPTLADGDTGEVKVDVMLKGPKPEAMISIFGHTSSKDGPIKDLKLVYHEAYPKTRREFGKYLGRHPHEEIGDLSQRRSFTDRTLKTIAKLFSGEFDAKEKR
jgi:hypothetical protein